MKSIATLFAFLFINACLIAQNVAPPPPPPPPPAPENGRIFRVIEEQPMFPGCDVQSDKIAMKKCADKLMMQFIGSKLQYPKIAKDNGVEGTVMIRFVVNIDGSIQDAEIIRNIGAGCGKEALRVVELFPDWIPGKVRGKAVRTQVNLPVTFNPSRF